MVSDQSILLYKEIYPCLSIMQVHKAIHQLFLRYF